jgi:hypothetical protein
MQNGPHVGGRSVFAAAPTNSPDLSSAGPTVGTNWSIRRWCAMPDDLRSQIIAEMKHVESEIDQQKRLIKNNVENKLVIETAEQEMRALHTRLSALEANLAKEEAAD